MDIALREWDHDFVFFEQLPDPLEHFRSHAAQPVLRVVNPEPDFEVDSIIAKAHHQHGRHRAFEDARIVLCRFCHQPFSQLHIGAIGHAHGHFDPHIARAVGPIDHLIDHQVFVGDQIFGLVAGHHRDGADADPADLAETLVARLIGDRNHIPRLDRPVHQQDQSGNQIAEGLLQAEADGKAERAGKNRKCSQVDTQQVDANKEGKGPDQHRGDLVRQYTLGFVQASGSPQQRAADLARRPGRQDNDQDQADSDRGVPQRHTRAAKSEGNRIERIDDRSNRLAPCVRDIPEVVRRPDRVIWRNWCHGDPIAVIPCSRTAIRSSGSSSPIDRRTPKRLPSSTPGGGHCMESRMPDGSKGRARLSYPPQLYPMPNRSRLSTSRALAAGSVPFKITLNSPQPPAKSRRHSLWPLSPGNNGHSTCATSGRVCSHWAIRIADFVLRSSLTPMVRRPLSANAASSGDPPCPNWGLVRRRRRYQCSPAEAEPIIRSEWPPTCLLRLITDMSQPCASAVKPSGVAQVLSIRLTATLSRAIAASAGTSHTSIVRLPGLSSHTALV